MSVLVIFKTVMLCGYLPLKLCGGCDRDKYAQWAGIVLSCQILAGLCAQSMLWPRDDDVSVKI